MASREILDLLYESDHKTFYAGFLRKSGSYIKTETVWTGTPQVIIYNAYGSTIGKATEYSGEYIKHEVLFTDKDGNRLGTAALEEQYNGRVRLVFRNAQGHEISHRDMPPGFKTQKMKEREKPKDPPKNDPPPGGGGGGGGGGVHTVNPWPFLLLGLLLSLPMAILAEHIVTTYPGWILQVFQIRVFLLKFTEFWVYPALAVLFVLTVRVPKGEGFDSKFLWVLLLAGVLTAQFFLSRQLGRMLHALGLGVVGFDNVKIFLLCFLPSLVLFFGATAVLDILRKKNKLSGGIHTMILKALRLNQIFSAILLYVCRMTAAWAFQMTAQDTTVMGIRTVWYAFLVFVGFWAVMTSGDN